MKTISTTITNGVQTVFPVSFGLGYIDRAHVYVYTGSVYTQQIGYTWINSTTIETDQVLPSGTELTIRRVIPKTQLINDYTNAAILEEQNLDNSFKQALMWLEEIEDGFMSSDDTWIIRNKIKFLGDLDMNGFRVKNLPQPVDSTDAARVQDVLTLASGMMGANYIGEAAPATVFNGMRWYNPAIPTTFTYYVDGDSGQWLEETAQGVDGKLRQDLADVNSTLPIAGIPAKAFRTISGIKDLLPIENVELCVVGFYSGTTVGGGSFVYKPNMSTSLHNGGTVIAAAALGTWDGTQAGLSTFLSWSGVGVGCYVRTNYDRVKITYFGALPSQLGGNNNQQIPVNKAINSFAGTFNELHAPSGIYYVSDKISMKPAVTLEGDGAEATWFTRANGVTSDSVISAEFTGSGADYIYIRKMTVNGNRQNGGVGKGVVFDNVHVPSYLDDVTVLWCSQANIDIKKSTVIQLNRVWSNGGNTLALDVDSVRSLHIIGGAYEHSESGTAHIRIRNTHNYYYPQATITGGHIEGLLVAGMSGIEVGGGSEYYSVQGLAIAGLQTLGKRVGGESNNYAIKILDDNCQITVMGESHTGLTSFVTGAKAGWPVPPVSAFSISNWHYIGNPSSGYNMPAAELTDKEGDLFKVISQQIVTVPAFSQTEQGIVIPTRPGTDYDVFVQVGGFMGNNISYYVPEADKTNGIFKIKFVNLTTGAAAQLQNATSFKVLVTSR